MKQPVSGPKDVESAGLSRSGGLKPWPHHAWEIIVLAEKKFSRIYGLQWAHAFAFNAFYSLFPLILLCVTIASIFIDHARAGTEIIAYVERYVPISGEMQRTIFDTITGVVNARGQASAVALIFLVWASIQCFSSLISATNLAWGAEEYSWWRLPMKSLILFGILILAILLGITVPVLVMITREWLLPVINFRSWVYDLVGFLIPFLTVFFSLCLFYKLAPKRHTHFAEVWLSALCATVFLQGAERLFIIYLTNFARLNAVYGTFGGIMALMLWIYLSGVIFVFGACLCAAQAEIQGNEVMEGVRGGKGSV